MLTFSSKMPFFISQINKNVKRLFSVFSKVWGNWHPHILLMKV